MNDKIDIDLVEDEDLARAKAWWKENGTSIISGIAIGSAMVVGYSYWNTYQAQRAQDIAQLYESYISAPQVDENLKVLLEKGSTTVYAHLARMRAAKEALDDQDFPQAEKYLGEVMQSGADEGLRRVAVLRLSNVLLAQKKADEAIALLNTYETAELPLMQARIAELKADAYIVKGDADQARELYEKSIELLGEIGQSTTLLQLKLDNA